VANIGQKTTVPAAEEMAEDCDSDSPLYSPTPSAMERPSLHPQLSLDLRQACAHLVSMTNPPDPDEDEDDQDALRRYEAERKAKYLNSVRAAQAKAAEAEARTAKEHEINAKKDQPRKDQPSRYSLRRRRQEAIDATSKNPPPPAQNNPKHPAPTVGVQNGRRKPPEILGASIEPLPPVHATIVQKSLKGRSNEVEELKHIRDSMHIRPKTSAAACIDYDATSGASSGSTSRSNSDYHAVHQAASTGMTSAALTPSMDGRMSRNRRPSDESYRDKEDTEAWIRELARRRADEYISSGRASRNGKRTSRFSRFSRKTSGGGSDDDRPGSRAGSIASGISNYIRNAGSTTSLNSNYTGRSGRSSAMGFSRPESRSSSMSRRSSSDWWRRPGLRRKGSWASFRSGRPEDKEAKSHRKNGEPNLNRPLPALPGLDSYKETKTHIGQLMKSGRKGKKVKKSQISEPQPFLPPETSYTATLPKPSPSAPAFHSEGESSPYLEYSPHTNPFESPIQPSSAPLPHQSPVPISPAPAQKPHVLATSTSTSALPKQRPRRGSASTGTSRKKNVPHQPPPLVIRGPSYHQELAQGVYPRPMDVNTGVPAHGSTPATINSSEVSKVATVGSNPNVMLEMPPRRTETGWERKGGLKGRVGKLFGGSKNGDMGCERGAVPV